MELSLKGRLRILAMKCVPKSKSSSIPNSDISPLFSTFTFIESGTKHWSKKFNEFLRSKSADILEPVSVYKSRSNVNILA
jgi:hypothetical protein